MKEHGTAHGGGAVGKPPWLRVRIGGGPNFVRLQTLVRKSALHTVCDEALCPNKGMCWEHSHATFLILGDKCTRGCAFCNVTAQRPGACDKDEPRRVAEAISSMGISEIVLTSVTRDDLEDGGAAIWAETIERVREAVPGATIEALVPDFGGSEAALRKVLRSRPDVFGHNLETVPSLYAAVRAKADYGRSLGVLREAHRAGLIAKTAIMVGMGESEKEVLTAMRDALEAGCEILFVGQYLRPSKRHLPVNRYVEPVEFDGYREEGLAMGFKVVVAAPLVRSSYHSDEQAEYVRQMRKVSRR